MQEISLNMAEVCDGGFVQPANESLLAIDHPLMRYDDQLFEDGGETGLKLPNQIYDNHDQKIREINQTPITNMQRQPQPQHQKTRKQRIHRYCYNCFHNTQHACWTCCIKCCECKCSDCDCRNTQCACWTCCIKCCQCKCSDCDCCDLKSCYDCCQSCSDCCSDCYDSCYYCYDSCYDRCDLCFDCYALHSLRYQFRECCGYCFLPCITLIRWTGGIFAMIIVMVTVILITLIAYSAIDCTTSSIPTIVALGTVFVLTSVCICTFKYDSYCMRREGLFLFFIALFLGLIFVAAVVIDSVYIFNADQDPEQQSTTTICNKYDNIVYIALSYFYALIVFTCCGCGCTYCLTRCRRFRR